MLRVNWHLLSCCKTVHSTRNLATDCVAAVGCIREHCNSSASAAAVWFSGQYRITDDPPAAQCAVDNPLLYHGLAHYFSQARNPSKCTQCHNGSEPSGNNGFWSQTSLPRLVDPFLHSSPVCPTYRQTHRQTTGLYCDICGSGPCPWTVCKPYTTNAVRTSFVGAKFYCSHALAGGNQCHQIWDKMLEFFSTAFYSPLSPYL